MAPKVVHGDSRVQQEEFQAADGAEVEQKPKERKRETSTIRAIRAVIAKVGS